MVIPIDALSALRVVATLGKRERIGPVPEGIRINVEITGGEVTGPKVSGKLGASGGDWITVRRDGVVMLDVRATIETHDAALIYLTYQGISDLGEHGYDQFATAARQGSALRINPHFHTPLRTTCGSIGSNALASVNRSPRDQRSPTTFTPCVNRPSRATSAQGHQEK